MPNTNNNTIEYYDSHADIYFSSTVEVDMSECCERFIKYLCADALIIDIGAGSGRDIKYFLDRGYKVEGFDASPEMCKLASKFTGVDVKCQKIQEWNPNCCYDGIWANASLLHLTIEEVCDFVKRLPRYINDGGVVYMSFKSGINTGIDVEGRYFTNVTRNEICKMVNEDKQLSILDMWETYDNLRRQGFVWINLILGKRNLCTK